MNPVKVAGKAVAKLFWALIVAVFLSVELNT